MKNNRGITLVTLIAYIILAILVISMLTALAAHFKKNLNNVTEISSRDVEFDKINLQLLKETKTEGNLIDENNSTDSRVTFTNGNTYTYKVDNKAIYLNDNIKVATDISSCKFDIQKEDKRQRLNVEIEINGTTRNTTYYCTNPSINYVKYIESTGTQYIDTGVSYDSSNKYLIYYDLQQTVKNGLALNGWDAGRSNRLGK